MLRPLHYQEDLMCVYPCLKGVGPFPLKAIVALIDRSKMELSSTTDQVNLWESLTSTPFDPPLKTLSTEAVDITCPRCLTINNTPWINNEGTGVGQKFSGACESCGLFVHSGALSVGKFLRDMVSPGLLPHTVFNSKGFEDLESARAISQIIKEKLNISNTTDGDQFEWNMANIEAVLFACPDVLALVGAYRMKQLLSAYDHPAASSFDLKPAVMRQARFISKMHDIEWAGETSLSANTSILDAIIRYHHFFLRSSEISILSVDTDMAFHTHLLFAASFINDCRRILGCVLDHDDSTERSDGEIDQALSLAIKVWESIPYPISAYRSCRKCSPLRPSGVCVCSSCGQESCAGNCAPDTK